MRKKKRSSKKGRDKVEKRDEISYQGMAIRSIANREKRREEEKSKTPKESSDNVSNPIKRDQASQKDKTGRDNKDETTFTEVFDSSKYDSMVKMEKSASIKEGEHLKEVLTSVEKEKPIDHTTTNATESSEVDINSTPPKATTVLNATPPNLEERESNLRDSKEEQIAVGNKELSKEEIIESKDKKTASSQSLDESYTNFWREATKSWTDLYVESARNVAQATEYWLDLFSKPWLSCGRIEDKSI